MEKLLGGIVARYQEQFQIEIYADCFNSNHPHMLVRAPNSNIDEFLENVHREIARRVNWKNRRQGKFWARRYDDQKVLNQEDLLEAFLYITTNPVKHGLVDHPAKWPGLSSYWQTLEGKVRQFSFYHYSQDNPAHRVTRHKLTIKRLPQFEELSEKEYRTTINQLIEDRTQQLVTERKANGLGFLGVEAVLRQIPGSIPQSVARSPRPSCYSKDAAAIKAHLIEARARNQAYDEASMRFRLGDHLAEFPTYTFKPPLHRKPRLLAFTPLPEDYFKIAA